MSRTAQVELRANATVRPSGDTAGQWSPPELRGAAVSQSRLPSAIRIKTRLPVPCGPSPSSTARARLSEVQLSKLAGGFPGRRISPTRLGAARGRHHQHVQPQLRVPRVQTRRAVSKGDPLAVG